MKLTRASYEAWSATHAARLHPPDKPVSTTPGGFTVEPVYTPLSLGEPSDAELEAYGEKLGLPGEPPFTRGIKPGMYREGPWVMGMYSGRASPKESNQRIRTLLASGQTGFSVALDLPTQLGMDSDHPLAAGEVGKVGVPIDSLKDMVELLDGVELDKVSQIRTTANAIGPIAVALFVVAAEQLGYRGDQFKVMLQNDVLKEYIARNTHIFPVDHGCDFSVDVIEYCARELPHWEPIEFCGYHIRDAGSTPVQEIAIALGNALEYLRRAVARGVDIDDFAHSVYLFLSSGLDIFEEAAKFRAARRIWSDLVVERFGAKKDSSRALHMFCYTLGGMQTAQEPVNNIIRISYQALAAVLGGVQTLATSSFDEALQLPSPAAAQLGLRTQQILALETGVTRAADPLGGSYLVEALTDHLEAEIRAYLQHIEDSGGAVAAIDSGMLEAEIETEAYRYAQRVESGELPVVGVNRFAGAPTPSGLTLGSGGASVSPELEREQIARLHALRAERDGAAVEKALEGIRDAARNDRNTVPAIIEAVRAYATVGEITSALADVWGRFRDHP